MGNICCCAKTFRFKRLLLDIYPVKKRGKTVDGPRVDLIGQLKSYIKTNPQRIPRVCRKIKKLIVRDISDIDVKGVSVGFFILKEIISDCQTAKELDYYTAHCVDIVSLVLRHVSELNRMRRYTDYNNNKAFEPDAVAELQMEACDTIAMLTFQLAKTSGARLRPTIEAADDNVLIVGLKSAFSSSGGTAIRQLADTAETVFRTMMSILATPLRSSDIIQVNYRYAAYVVISNYTACLQRCLSTVVEEVTPIILSNFMSSLTPFYQKSVRARRNGPVIGGKYLPTIQYFNTDILSRISLKNTVLLSLDANEKDASFIQVSAGALYHLTLCPTNSELKKYCSYITDFCLRSQSWRNHHFIEEVFKLITYALEFGRGSDQEGICGGYLVCQHLCDEVSVQLIQVGDTVSLCGVLIAVQTVLSTMTMSYEGQSSNSGTKLARRIAFNLVKQLLFDEATYSEINWSLNVGEQTSKSTSASPSEERAPPALFLNSIDKHLTRSTPVNTGSCGIVCLFDVLVGVMSIIVNDPIMGDLGAGTADIVQFTTEMIGAAKTASTRQILCGCLEVLAILAPLVRRNNAGSGTFNNIKVDHQRIDLLGFVMPFVPRLDDEVWDSAMNVILGYLRLSPEEIRHVAVMEEAKSNNSLELKAARLLHVIENNSLVNPSFSSDERSVSNNETFLIKRSDGYLINSSFAIRPPLFPQSTETTPLAEEDDELIILVLTRLLLLNGDLLKDIQTASGKLAYSLFLDRDIEKIHSPHTLQIVGNLAAAYCQAKGSGSTTFILSLVFSVQELMSSINTPCTALAQCLGHLSIAIIHVFSNVIGNKNLTKYCIDVFSNRYEMTTDQGKDFGPWFSPRVAAEIIPLEMGFEAQREYENLELYNIPVGKIHSMLSIPTVLTYLGVTNDVLKTVSKTHALMQHPNRDLNPLAIFSAAAKALINNPYLMLAFTFFIDLKLPLVTEYKTAKERVINGADVITVPQKDSAVVLSVSGVHIDGNLTPVSSEQLSDPPIVGDERNQHYSFLNISKMLFRSPRKTSDEENADNAIVGPSINQDQWEITTLALQKRLSFIGNYPCFFFDTLRSQLRALHRTGALEATNINHRCNLCNIRQKRRISSSVLDCTSMDYYGSPLSIACDQTPSVAGHNVKLISGGITPRESREQSLRDAGISVCSRYNVSTDEEYSENESVLYCDKSTLLKIPYKSMSLYTHYTPSTSIPIPLVAHTRVDRGENASQIFRIRTDSKEITEPFHIWKRRRSKFG